MSSLVTPLWLLGLLVIPVIWWMHRQGPQAPIKVSSMVLWRGLVGESATAARKRRADPRWLLRAAICAAIILALAGPQYPRVSPRITIWIDDSPSMLTIEAGVARWQSAVAELVGELQAAAPAEVKVRSLHDHSYQLHSAGSQLTQSQIESWYTTATENLQVPENPDPQFQHWLVTDGADINLRDWASEGRLSRTIFTGYETENIGITNLAVRRSVTQLDHLKATLRLVNAGYAAADRDLVVDVGDIRILEQNVHFEARETVEIGFGLSVATGALTATLVPADALAPDDKLTVQLDAFLPVHVSKLGECGTHLTRALATHPALTLVESNSAASVLDVVCIDAAGEDDAGLSRSKNVLAVHRGADFVSSVNQPVWQGDAAPLNQLFLAAAMFAIDPLRMPDANAQVLLNAGDQDAPLVTQIPGRVDVYFDLQTDVLAQRLDYPVLVNKLLEQAAGRALLDPVIRQSRDASELQIASLYTTSQTSPPVLADAMVQQDLTAWIIATAALLVCADLLLSRADRSSAPGSKA